MLSRLLNTLDWIRRITVNLVFLAVVVAIIAAIAMNQPRVPDQGALILNPKGALVEQLTLPAPGAFPFAAPTGDQSRMRDLLDAIHAAGEDARIRVMVLDLSEMNRASLSKLQELRRAIDGFKKHGKKVYAFGNTYTQAQYYLAASADKVFLHPMGMVVLRGLGLYRNYFKDALDKLDVKVHLFRAGTYKSAAEPLVRNNMSAADRMANATWLNHLWDAYKRDVAEMRGIKPEALQSLLDHPAQHLEKQHSSLARLALSEGLVDKLASEDEADAAIAAELGLKGTERFPAINYHHYLKAIDRNGKTHGDSVVGIITASGTIQGGKQPSGTIGGESLSTLLDKARRNPRIKSVVLRIDSPGGSALASEEIRERLEKLRRAGKPVVVSMGSMAASGAYWIASAADEIWASPTTLTGSIGVFGLFAELHDGLEKLGIHSDGIGTTSIAGGMRMDRPMNPELARVFQMSVDDIYQQFIEKVAKGRKMTPDTVEKVAEGRVWSGIDAKRLGLVDHLGGLKQAIAAAADKAGIAQHYGVLHIHTPRRFMDRLYADMMGEAKAWMPTPMATMLPASLHGVADGMAHLGAAANPTGIYAYCGIEAP
ncbi:MAG TPA: signal peptide peptidase SppA [Mariprofundaceae bacterium]|nr:signal peptide peptidase SppA [Mariprofundaceae bacterium]